MAVGRCLGRLFYWLPNKRKAIAQTNIKRCFPELDDRASNSLLYRNLVSTGQGVSEMLAALWCPSSRLSSCFTFSGMEYLTAQLAQGKGALLLSCHTTSVEWGIRGLNHHLKKMNLPVAHMLARQHNNKKLEAHYQSARKQYAEKVIDKKDMRSLLRSIKDGHGVIYAPDQNFSYHTEFIPFFNQAAATTIGPAKLTHSAKLTAIPWFCFRTAASQWHVQICPPLSAMGSADYESALTQMNRLFEAQIRKYPEQYLWVHRRFKNQPPGAPPFY